MARLRYYVADHKISVAEKAGRLLLRRQWPVWSFPRIIQIQTHAGCNAKCVFCPNGKTRSSLPTGSMDWDLYRKIIDECVRYRMWRISPYLMNEPLLDPEIGERIRYITERRRFPTYTKINTNASLLTGEMAEQLLESGLQILTCSVHGIDRELYNKTMLGLDLDRTLANIDRFLEIKRKRRARRPELRVTMVRTTLIEPQLEHIQRHWKSRNVRFSIRPMTNRANGKVASLNINARPLQPYRWCVRMMEQAYVNVRGEVLLCCNDWEQSTVLGDLSRQSLYEIWNGERFQEIRRRFLANDLKGLICQHCTMQPE